MTLYCDECGGPRLNGAPVIYVDGEMRLATATDPRHEVEYYCRSCAIEVTRV